MAGIIADGIVDRVFYDGKGIAFHEEFKKQDGSTGKAYFTAWFDEAPGLEPGATGTFKGQLSVKLREYTTDSGEVKHTADASINNTRFEAAGGDEPF